MTGDLLPSGCLGWGKMSVKDDAERDPECAQPVEHPVMEDHVDLELEQVFTFIVEILLNRDTRLTLISNMVREITSSPYTFMNSAEVYPLMPESLGKRWRSEMRMGSSVEIGARFNSMHPPRS